MSLVADNEDIEKGDRFQDELRKGFEKFETAGQQIEMAYQNAERTLKKRIKNEVWLSNYKYTNMGKKFGNCSSKHNVPSPPPVYSVL